MACEISKLALYELVLSVLTRYTSSPITDQSILGELVSALRWKVDVFPEIRRLLRERGCCFKTRTKDFYDEDEQVGNVVAEMKADLEDCPLREMARTSRELERTSSTGKKKKKKGARP